MDRDMQKMRNEEAKLKKEIKTMATKGQLGSVKTLAKQVVRSKKAITRMERSQASMRSVSLQLTTAIASMSSATSLQMSAGMMKEMNRLMSVEGLAGTMEEMRQQMARAEMADEILDEGFDESDDETEVDTEIAKVFDELALDKTSLLITPDLAAPAAAAPAQAAPADDPLLQRLAALQK